MRKSYRKSYKKIYPDNISNVSNVSNAKKQLKEKFNKWKKLQKSLDKDPHMYFWKKIKKTEKNKKILDKMKKIDNESIKIGKKYNILFYDKPRNPATSYNE